MVALQDLLPEFLLSLVNVCVELISVLPDREFLIVINGDVNLSQAVLLIIRVVELSYIGML